MSDTINETNIKSKKQKVDKYNGFKVPSRTRKSTKWTIYIYDMIKEAKPELLLVDLVKNAYNNLVDCLMKYENTLETSIPNKYYKYGKDGNGIILKAGYGHIMGIPGRWTYTWDQQNDPVIKENIKKYSKEIADIYNILFELIKRDIIPYMEIKNHEIKTKKDIEYYHNQMEKLEHSIKIYEQAITNTRKTLCEFAEKALKLQDGAILTNFD